jgi:Ca2+-binding EF-hand superfamily protein
LNQAEFLQFCQNPSLMPAVFQLEARMPMPSQSAQQQPVGMKLFQFLAKGDGKISFQEFTPLCASLGLQFQQAQQLWYVVDNDRSGSLDLAEFVRFCSLPQMVQNIMRFEASIPQQSHMVQPQQFPVGHVLFQMLDSKRDGSISFQEFCPLGQQLGIPFQQAQQLW